MRSQSCVVAQMGTFSGIDTMQTCHEVDFEDEDRVPLSKNFVLFLLGSICKCAGMTIILTTSKEYTAYVGLTSSFWAGFMIGAVPLFGGLSSFLWQPIHDRMGYKYTNVVMCASGAVGSVLYSLAGACNSPAMLITGRMIVGAASPSNIMLHFMAVTTGKRQKSKRMTYMIIGINIGLALGPLISALIAFVFGTKLGLDDSAPIIFNTLSIPGWALALMYTLLALGFLFIFEGVPLSEQHRYRDYAKVNSRPGDSSPTPSVGVGRIMVLLMFLFAITVIGIAIGGVETRTGFIATGNTISNASTGFAWGFSPTIAGFYLFGVFFFFSFVCLLLNKYTKNIKTMEDRHWVLGCFCLGTLFSILLFDFHISVNSSIILWTIGLILFNGSLTIAKGNMLGLSLELCPCHWIDMFTTLMSLLNSVGRGIGPMIATYIGQGYLEADVFALILLALLCAVSASVALLFKQLDTKYD
mmetsp:Transcript_5842/g.13163  ORF Transcript_5842/g.13163 Transcript_5842/m.13163 type:complete len:470 (-) Transcript_5842:743-2152(-)